MRSGKFALAFLGLAAQVAPAVGAQGEAQALIRAARSQYEQRDFTAAQRTYAEAIASLEQDAVASGPELIEPLTGLADALIATGQRARAVEPLRRAVAIVRRSDGLYDSKQYELLVRLVDAQSLAGDLQAAAADLTYLERVSETAHGSQSASHAQSLIEVADWQCRIGQFSQARGNYRRSIAALGQESSRQPLIAALRGLAQCCLHELSAEGIETGADALERYRGPIVRSARMSPDNPAFRLHLEKYLRPEGERALRRAADLAAALDADARIGVLLQAGDWFQIKDHSRAAEQYYVQAEALLAKQTAGPDQPLAAPVQLLYPLPPSVLRYPDLEKSQQPVDYVELEFKVRADGRIISERVLARGPGKSAVDETLAALSVARFRPRVVGGRAVPSEVVRFRQAFRAVR